MSASSKLRKQDAELYRRKLATGGKSVATSTASDLSCLPIVTPPCFPQESKYGSAIQSLCIDLHRPTGSATHKRKRQQFPDHRAEARRTGPFPVPDRDIYPRSHLAAADMDVQSFHQIASPIERGLSRRACTSAAFSICVGLSDLTGALHPFGNAGLTIHP